MIIHELKSKLEDAKPDEVEEYVKSEEGSNGLLQWKFLTNLGKKIEPGEVHGTGITVSDCPELSENLLDGKPSLWWSSEDTAWIELDFGRPVFVSRLRIQWWGISMSKDFTVLAAGQDGLFQEVGSQKVDGDRVPPYNSWSTLRGWIMDTFRIRIELRDGILDPWNKGKKFGIRNIFIEEPPRIPNYSSWILISEPHILELLLTSGYVQDHKWPEVVDLLTQILNLDPEARKGGYRLNLAVAIALTFSSPVKSFASYNKATIDPLARYQNFVRWAEGEVLFPIHTSLSAWHLRYVVASWATDEELEWARDNVPDEFRNPAQIGEATHKMVAYTTYNANGVSIQKGAKFYNDQPQTLARIAEMGAVCGGISKFGVAMAQAFGIPAAPVGQPGHCAFLWWKESHFVLSNNISGIEESYTHGGIQWTWNKNSSYKILKEKAQQNREGFFLSEKLRWASKFMKEDSSKLKVLTRAIVICPANFLLWRDLVAVCHRPCTRPETYQSWVDEEIENINDVRDMTSSSTVMVSDCPERGQIVVDGPGPDGTCWWTGEETAWLELDLHRDCSVAELKIQWWGISVSKDYTVLAAGREGEFQKVCDTEAELESPEGYNSWSKLEGWDLETRKIRIELKDGQLDHWGKRKLFGIRRIVVQGKEVNPPKTLNALIKRKAQKCKSDGVMCRVVERDVHKLLLAKRL